MNYGLKQQTRKRLQQPYDQGSKNKSVSMMTDNEYLTTNYSPDRRQSLRNDISYFKNDSYERHAASTYRQNSKSKEKGRLSKMSNLLTGMMEKHQQMKRKLQILRKEKENRQEQALNQFSFSPKINYNPRYQIASTLDERNRSWDEARAVHFTSKKQEIVEKVCKECTFSPIMLAKRQSDNILNERRMKEQRERMNNIVEKRPAFEVRQINDFRKEVKGQSFLNKVNIKRIRELIKGEVKRIAFDF